MNKEEFYKYFDERYTEISRETLDKYASDISNSIEENHENYTENEKQILFSLLHHEVTNREVLKEFLGSQFDFS
ncbi:hypothetical protein [Staphylococcus intermedius]|uniref:Uncharacterized protein n=1 Tax=Staphylococcus intermedius NCTC 11048 TaxID=1141106 RepID=A0A380G955_STAIN|nr:hypothetical protein [Staphylococcus intermedius]PNZ52450.1 hypothetical protein CD138_06420 [Staphylococcus intermedius NCTC 11048]SUM47282.1 Uncharacterised protein [Staphylococcus intermedius NCTC 11048]SUM47693.1 Uncharacterised protein [Staphylococcus intermedius NCTC 11048]